LPVILDTWVLNKYLNNSFDDRSEFLVYRKGKKTDYREQMTDFDEKNAEFQFLISVS